VATANPAVMGKGLREWPLDCSLPSITATSSRDEKLNRVQILLQARATELNVESISVRRSRLSRARFSSMRFKALRTVI
jgi:hypothetical protein